VPAGFDWDRWGPAEKKPYNAGRVAWPDWYLIWDYCAGFICNWGVHHLEYYLEAQWPDGPPSRFPATAPALNQTLVLLPTD
jgi:hypothetical protein